jgi:hypothetical protein
MTEHLTITESAPLTPPAVTGRVRRPVKKTPAPTVEPARVPTQIRFHSTSKQRGEYWASKNNISFNEYVSEALDEKVRRENQDYDLPTLEIARLNQLVDEMKALSTNQANLERILIKGLDSLLGLARGDSNYLGDETGEL